jgi:phosphopantothenoylcysteine decarboxylase/phosphopantothenate--cysteine ligase
MSEKLSGKRILLGVTGGIAAYKIPNLVRLLKKEGALVRVILSPSASWFVAPKALSVVSENPVWEHFFDPHTQTWNNHVEAALWADVILVAPCTASTLSKLVQGYSDNLLVTTLMCSRCPVLIAPAMDLDMFKQESVQQNLHILASRGMRIIEPETGALASGLHGKGRMPEPETLFNEVYKTCVYRSVFAGKKVLVTAGPTHEYIDTVRYIGNASSGKMGYALASAFQGMGADVELLSGPVALENPEGINTTRVVSASEMFEAFVGLMPKADVILCAAAVSDYMPLEKRQHKLKKTSAALTLELRKTPDLLKYAGEYRRKEQYLAGFALESENEMQHATEKLHAKKADLIVLNSLNDKGAGFGTDTNKVSLISHNNILHTGLLSKSEIAWEIGLYIAREKGLI